MTEDDTDYDDVGRGRIRERTTEGKLAALTEKEDEVGEELAKLAKAHLEVLQEESNNER